MPASHTTPSMPSVPPSPPGPGTMAMGAPSAGPTRGTSCCRCRPARSRSVTGLGTGASGARFATPGSSVVPWGVTAWPAQAGLGTNPAGLAVPATGTQTMPHQPDPPSSDPVSALPRTAPSGDPRTHKQKGPDPNYKWWVLVTVV